MTFKIKTEPAVEPVTLSEVRQVLGIAAPGDIARDAVIEARIVSARRWAEQHTRRAFITQTWLAYFDDFRFDYFQAPRRAQHIDLIAELQAVTAVAYTDINGAAQTLAADQYRVDTVDSRLTPAFGVHWPQTRLQANAVKIEFVSGFGVAADVPREIRDALLFIVGQWENYQSSIEGAVRPSTVPYACLQLLQPHVDMRNWI